MLELIAVQGSAVVRWWYIVYGFVGFVYGQGGAPTPGTGVAPVRLVAIPPGNILLEVTADPVVLKQLTEFW